MYLYVRLTSTVARRSSADYTDYADLSLITSVRAFLQIRVIGVANQQLLVFVARTITEPEAKRLHATEKNTYGKRSTTA
jgi:hypothetical protein